MHSLRSQEGRAASTLEAAGEPPPLLHPSMADVYRAKVEELAVWRWSARTAAWKRRRCLRGLIEAIVLDPEGRASCGSS